jgi:hypothetical protein
MDPREPSTTIVMGRRPESFSSLLGFRAWLASVVAVSLVFTLQPLYPGLIGPISNFLPAACAATAFASSASCSRRYGFGLHSRGFESVWSLFTVGTGLWIVAEATWAFYYFILRVQVPYPSAADVFYVGGYLPIIAGLAGYLDNFRVGLTKRRLGVALVVIGVAVALALTFVMPVELGRNLSAINVLTDMLYPVLDLTLVSLTVLCLAIFLEGTIAKWWMIFGVGAILYVIGDEFFLYQVANHTYYNGSVDDLIFLLGYLTFALAFYIHRKEF